VQQKFLILQGRNFGDAVIGSGLIEAIGTWMPDAEIAVLTRPLFVDIFRYNPHVSKVYVANFPMGTDKRFNTKEAWKLTKAVLALRRQRYTTVSMTGDFRENLLGWIINAKSNVGISWKPGHPYRRLVRQHLIGALSTAVAIPVDTISIYAAMQMIADRIGASAPARPRLYDSTRHPIKHQAVGRTVGVHMSASQECRIWPMRNWRALIGLLRGAGMAVKIFGAPHERARIMADLDGIIDDDVEVVTGSLRDFFLGFSEMQAVVCLDSFAIHAAYAVGVPSIMINGANMAEIWLPPGTELIDGAQGLACAPCMNQPTCLGTDRPYRCIRDITVERVWSALCKICEPSSSRSTSVGDSRPAVDML
jgi:heptosyltransferase III